MTSRSETNQNAGGLFGISVASWVVAAFSVPIALLVSRRFQKSLLAIAVLDVPLQIGHHFLFRQEAQDIGCNGGLYICLRIISIAGLYLAWLLRIAINRRPFAQPSTIRCKVTLPAVLFLLFCTVSLFGAGDLELGWSEIWSVLNLFLLYFYVAKIINSRSDVLFIVRVLLIGLIIESALMLAQAGGVVGSFNVFGIRASAEFVGTNRISGTLGSPNPAAAYLAMSMTFAAGVMLSDVGRTDKVLARLALVMAVVPFIYTLSRGGWLSFLLGVTILLGLGGRKVAWRAVGVALVVLVLLVSPFAGRIQQRLSSEEGKTAVEDRIPLNKVAFAMIEDHPLLGVGVNNYPLAMEPYLAHYLLSDFIYPVHNVYLLFFAETGIGGLIAFVWILFAIVREGAKCWRTGDRLLSPLALGCAGATVGFAVQMLFDPLRNCPAADLLWLFGGVVATMSRLSGSFSSTWETPTVEPLF